MKTIAIILSTIIFGLLLHFQMTSAQEIYKWIDEKGTTHYSEDPNSVPEKHRDKVQKKDINEFPPILSYTPQIPQPRSGEPSSNRTQRSRPVRHVESEPVGSGPSPGYIPHDKFIHLTNGMSEAEVLSRFGSPTNVEQDEAQTKGSIDGGTVVGHVSPGGSLSGTVSGGTIRSETTVIKRYYYIGDRAKGEKTTIIHIKKGRVFHYERI